MEFDRIKYNGRMEQRPGNSTLDKRRITFESCDPNLRCFTTPKRNLIQR